jgi:hypothetical protein
MRERHAFWGIVPFVVLKPRATIFGLLLAGSFAGVTLGQELHWAKRAGGTERDDVRRIAIDAVGNSYVTGAFEGIATFGAGEANQTILTGSTDMFVAKYDIAGALVWAKQAGTGDISGNDHASGSAIGVDGAGNSYVTGTFEGVATFGAGEANQTTLTGSGDIFVAKYDSGGALVWAKRAGGADVEEAYGIAVDGAGNSYVTGLFGYSDYQRGGTATFGAGEANETILTSTALYGDMFLAKYDSGGALVWVKRAGAAAVAFDIAVDTTGNSYLTGHLDGVATFGPGDANETTLATTEDNEVFVAKYDSAGALVWVKRAGAYAIGIGIAVDGVGNSYATGFFGGNGLFRATATFGAGEANQTILTGAGDGDIFVAKYDRAGVLLWAKRAGGTKTDGGAGIAVDGAGNSYVTGSFGSAATFGPEEANQTILSSAGDADLFVAKYDSSGALVWARRVGADASGRGIAVDAAGNSYVTGSFGGSATFGVGETRQTILSSAGDVDVFVAKYAAVQAGRGQRKSPRQRGTTSGSRFRTAPHVETSSAIPRSMP